MPCSDMSLIIVVETPKLFSSLLGNREDALTAKLLFRDSVLPCSLCLILFSFLFNDLLQIHKRVIVSVSSDMCYQRESVRLLLCLVYPFMMLTCLGINFKLEQLMCLFLVTYTES